MCVHCVYPAESLTWDDVCQLWDNGVYTAEEVKSIAALYFDGAELSAVLEVIENVENESQALEAMNTDTGDWDMQPAAMNIYIGAFDCMDFESVQILLEPGRNNPWRGLH
jgi:hypothetical protein